MRPGLIVKGRRYWCTGLRRHGMLPDYVISATGVYGGTLYEPPDPIVLVSPVTSSGKLKCTVRSSSLTYLSPDDAEMCQRLAEKAKMDWFNYELDTTWNMEVNREYDDRGHLRRTSFRNVIKQLSEGLIDEDFKRMPDPVATELRFRDIVIGMGFKYPGTYFKED